MVAGAALRPWSPQPWPARRWRGRGVRAAARGAALRGSAQASSRCSRRASEGLKLPADPETCTASTFRPLGLLPGADARRARARHDRPWSLRARGGSRERGGTPGAGRGLGGTRCLRGGARRHGAGFERDTSFEGGLRIIQAGRNSADECWANAGWRLGRGDGEPW